MGRAGRAPVQLVTDPTGWTTNRPPGRKLPGQLRFRSNSGGSRQRRPRSQPFEGDSKRPAILVANPAFTYPVRVDTMAPFSTHSFRTDLRRLSMKRISWRWAVGDRKSTRLNSSHLG